MNKEKQMLDDLIKIFDEECEKRHLITPQNTAKKMIAKGYRKQSEWISVDEALPKPFVSVLAYCPIRCNIYGVYLNARGEWHFFDESAAGALLNVTVSHWMPLPEAPKMKGGAE